MRKATLTDQIEQLLEQLEANKKAKRYALLVDGLWFMSRLLEHPVLQDSFNTSWLDRLNNVAIKVLDVVYQQVQEKSILPQWCNHINKLAHLILQLSKNINHQNKTTTTLQSLLNNRLKTKSVRPILNDWSQLDWQAKDLTKFNKIEKRRIGKAPALGIREELNNETRALSDTASLQEKINAYLKTIESVMRTLFPWLSISIFQRPTKDTPKQDLLEVLAPLYPFMDTVLPLLRSNKYTSAWQFIHIALYWIRDQRRLMDTESLSSDVKEARSSVSKSLIMLPNFAYWVKVSHENKNAISLLSTLCDHVLTLQQSIIDKTKSESDTKTLPLFDTHRNQLKTMRLVWENLKWEKAREAQEQFSDDSHALVNTLFKTSVQFVGDPPGKIALFLTGSSSRKDRMPQSDIEGVLMYEARSSGCASQMRAYAYTVLSFFELLVILCKETHQFGLQSDAGFHLDSSDHILDKKMMGTVDEIYDKYVHNPLLKNPGLLVLKGEMLYALLTLSLVNKEWGGLELSKKYQEKVEKLLDTVTNIWTHQALQLAYQKNEIPPSEKRETPLINSFTYRKTIALYCWVDVLRKAEDALKGEEPTASKDNIRPQEIIDIKNAYHKPVVYFALNLQLYLNTTAGHPMDMFECAFKENLLSYELKKLFQAGLMGTINLRSRLHMEKGAQEEMVNIDQADLTEEVRSRFAYLARLFTVIKKALEHYLQMVVAEPKKTFVLDEIINDYWPRALLQANGKEAHEQWFVDVTGFLLYTRASLVAHRYYYRQLPEKYRKEAVLSAKHYFTKIVPIKDALWPKDPLFWKKLWDVPLPDGSRLFSHPEEEARWKQGLSTLLSPKTSIPSNGQKALPLFIHSLVLGARHLKPSIVKTLLEKGWMYPNGKFVDKASHPVASKMPGNHLVIPWPLENPQFYLKVYPEIPLVDRFLNDLDRRLGYYLPRNVDLWLWQYGDKHYPVLASAGVLGPSLHVTLKGENPLPLNPYAFTQSMVTSAFSQLEDNNPDNIIYFKDRFFFIDADRWFALPFKGNKLNAKNIVFCLHEMDMRPDPLWREEFLSLNPRLVSTTWIAGMEKEGNQCIKIFGDKIEKYFNGILRKAERKTLVLPPLKLHVVNDFFYHMQSLQDLLSDSNSFDRLTHWDLLAKINRRLANHYLLAAKQHNNILARFKQVAGHAYLPVWGGQQGFYTSKIDFKTQMEDMWEGIAAEKSINESWIRDINDAKKQLRSLNQREGEKQLTSAKQNIRQGNLERFKKLTLKGKEKLLEGLDWSTLSKRNQRLLLNQMITEGHWRNLVIKNSQVVITPDLRTLLQKSPSLKRLVLINCPNLSHNMWDGLPEQDCTLTVLHLEGLPRVKYIGYLPGIILGEKCQQLPNLQKLYVNCSNLEQINMEARLLEKFTLVNTNKVNVVRTQSQHLKHFDLQGPDPARLKDWRLIMDPKYAYRLNRFSWSGYQKPTFLTLKTTRSRRLRLTNCCPTLLAIEWNRYEATLLNKVLMQLFIQFETLSVDYSKLTEKGRQRLLTEINILFDKSIHYKKLLALISTAKLPRTKSKVQEFENPLSHDPRKRHAIKDGVIPTLTLHNNAQFDETLIKGLKNSDYEIRKKHVNFLISNDCSWFVDSVTKRLKQEEDPEIKVGMAVYLSKNKQQNEEVITILINGLKDKDAKVRMLATRGLACLESPSAEVIKALILTLTDPDSTDTRAKAADSLKQLETRTEKQVVQVLNHFKEKLESITAGGLFTIFNHHNIKLAKRMFSSLEQREQKVMSCVNRRAYSFFKDIQKNENVVDYPRESIDANTLG